MSFIDFIILLFIAGICGSIARTLVGYTQRGCIFSMITGFIGALIGMWIGRKLNLPEFFVVNIGHTSFPVLWSIIGSVIFAGMLNLLSSRK